MVVRDTSRLVPRQQGRTYFNNLQQVLGFAVWSPPTHVGRRGLGTSRAGLVDGGSLMTISSTAAVSTWMVENSGWSAALFWSTVCGDWLLCLTVVGCFFLSLENATDSCCLKPVEFVGC